MVRMITQFMNHGDYKGEAYIYSHKEVLNLIQELANKLLQKKEADFIGKKLHLVEVHDGENLDIIGHKVTFFDIQSAKAKQFGHVMDLQEGEKLICCGDEPLTLVCEKYAGNAKWLLHKAFCLYSQADIFDPYEKHHSTVKDACILGEKLNVQNLLLYHTEDKNIQNRSALYKEEGKNYFSKNLWIPDDLQVIEL